MLNMRIIFLLLMLCGYCVLGYGQVKSVAVASPAADALRPALQSVHNVGFRAFEEASLLLGPHMLVCNDYADINFVVMDWRTGKNITPAFTALDSVLQANAAEGRKLPNNLVDFELENKIFCIAIRNIVNQHDTLHLLVSISRETLEAHHYTAAQKARARESSCFLYGREYELADTTTTTFNDFYLVRWMAGCPMQWAKIEQQLPVADTLGFFTSFFMPLSPNEYALEKRIDTLTLGPMPFFLCTTVDWAMHCTTPHRMANHRLPAGLSYAGDAPFVWARYQNGGLLLKLPNRYFPDGNLIGIAPIALPEGYRQNAVQAITPHGQNHLGVYWGKNETTLHVALFSPDCTTRLASATLPERPDQRTDDALQPVAAAIDADNVAVLWNDGQVYVYSLFGSAASKPASPGKKKKSVANKHS